MGEQSPARVDARRIVLVQADGRQGTGQLLTSRVVLTAGHVVDHARTVRVISPLTGRPAACTVRYVRHGGRYDVALLEADEDIVPGIGVPRLGRSTSLEPVPAYTVGFPALSRTETDLPDSRDVPGTLRPGSGMATDRYVFAYHPDELGDTQDPRGWKGLSGAGVWARGLLMGIAVEVPRDTSAHINVVPSYLLWADPQIQRALRWAPTASPVLEAVELVPLAQPAGPPPAPRSISRLLHPAAEVVTFGGRGDELQELTDWCLTSDADPSVRLLTGPGGAGKSRLARELVHRMAAEGWATVHLLPRVPAGDLERLRDVHPSLLIVLDYAEMRTEQVDALLRALARSPGPRAAVRVVLISRTAGDWWEELPLASAEAADVLASAVVMEIDPLAADAADRPRLYQQAASDLAPRLGGLPGVPTLPWQDIAATLTTPDLRSDRHAFALTLHMTALADVLGAVPETAPPLPDLPVEEQLLIHEERYWRQSARGRPSLHRIAADRWALGQAVAAATLAHAADAHRYETILGLLEPWAGQAPQVRGDAARWLHDLYPGPDGGAWGVLEPDRLGEYHVGRTVLRHAGVLDRLVPELDEPEVATSLDVLARTAEHPDHHEHISRAVRHLVVSNPEKLAEVTVTATTRAASPGPLREALDAVLDEPELPLPLLWDIQERIPDTTEALAHWSERLYGVLVARHRDLAADGATHHIAQLSRALNSWSVALAQLGRHDEALEANTETVTLCRGLMTVDSFEYLPDLAQALVNAGNRLVDRQRGEEALLRLVEGAGCYRRLIVQDPGLREHRSGLIIALNNQAYCLGDLGRVEEAAECAARAVDEARAMLIDFPEIEEAREVLLGALTTRSALLRESGRTAHAREVAAEVLDARRQLAEEQPDRFRADLAAALWNKAVDLSEEGLLDEAERASAEAVDIYRDLARRNPRHLPDLAEALDIHANDLGDLGRVPAAAACLKEAVDVFRRLPDEYRGSLAGALNHLATRQRELRHLVEAARAARESVALLRDLAGAEPQLHTVELAEALSTLGHICTLQDREEEAAAATREAVQLLRERAGEEPARYAPHLARALHNHAYAMSDEDHAEALAAAQESARIRRDLAQDDPELVHPQLAGTLHVAAYVLRELHRPAEALHHLRESEALLTPYADRPGPFKHSLAESLNNQANVLADLGRHTDAVDPVRKSVALLAELAEENPGRYLADLAEGLHHQTIREAAVGHDENAWHATREMVDVYEELAVADRDAFAPELASAWTDYATRARTYHPESVVEALERVRELYCWLAIRWPDSFALRAEEAELHLDAARATAGTGDDGVPSAH